MIKYILFKYLMHKAADRTCNPQLCEENTITYHICDLSNQIAVIYYELALSLYGFDFEGLKLNKG